MTTPSDPYDARAYARARAYVEHTAVAQPGLARAAGLAPGELARIMRAGVAPAPTYVVYPRAIASAVRTLGVAPQEAGMAFYGPAVQGWLRRAAVLRRAGADDLEALMRAWLARSFRQALEERPDDVRRFGFPHLFDSGALDEARTEAELEALWDDWMAGAWAVCLRRFDGRSLVAKQVERARIDALTDERRRAPETLSLEERLRLHDAVDALEGVLLPFAPHERPWGTPGTHVDDVRSRYGI